MSNGAPALSVSLSTIPSGTTVNLSAAGTLDWVHWGLFTADSVDRKAGVAPQIPNFQTVSSGFDSNSYVFAYQFSDNANGYSWSDGTPDATVTNTTTGVWAYGTPPPQFGTGFELRVPADTTMRVLKVYAGSYAAQGSFEAFLSDGSLQTNFLALANRANGPSGVFTINYSAASPTQQLIVRWTVSFTYRVDGNVTLQSAALSGNGANNPPIASITSPAENATFTAPTNVTINANASDLDGAITKVEFYDGDSRLGESTSSPYSFTWNSVPPGFHVLTAVATDTNADFSSSMPVEIFVNGAGGSLAGSHTDLTNASSVNLSAEGSADWAHWGLSTNNLFDHKSGVTQKISDFTVIGTNQARRYADNLTAFSWSDGTPSPTATNTTTGVFIYGVTNGFALQAPADTTPRELKVYVGLYGAQGNFQAYLSDFSAKAFTDTSISNFYDNSYAVYTLKYAAASAGQSLIVRYKALTLFDFDFGNVTLQAATLSSSSTNSAPLPVSLQLLYLGGNSFVFSFPSQSGYNYEVDYIGALGAGPWQVLTNVTGTGSTLSITNKNVPATQRFYRVKSQ